TSGSGAKRTCASITRLLFISVRESAPVLKRTRSGGPKNHAGDVSDISHAARLHVRDDAKTEKLDEEPKSDQERSRYEGDADEPPDNQNRANLIARVGDEERAHHSGDRSA